MDPEQSRGSKEALLGRVVCLSSAPLLPFCLEPTPIKCLLPKFSQKSFCQGHQGPSCCQLSTSHETLKCPGFSPWTSSPPLLAPLVTSSHLWFYILLIHRDSQALISSSELQTHNQLQQECSGQVLDSQTRDQSMLVVVVAALLLTQWIFLAKSLNFLGLECSSF